MDVLYLCVLSFKAKSKCKSQFNFHFLLLSLSVAHPSSLSVECKLLVRPVGLSISHGLKVKIGFVHSAVNLTIN